MVDVNVDIKDALLVSKELEDAKDDVCDRELANTVAYANGVPLI